MKWLKAVGFVATVWTAAIALGALVIFLFTVLHPSTFAVLGIMITLGFVIAVLMVVDLS